MPAPPSSTYTPSRGLAVVDYVCRKMSHQMSSDISLGGSWFKLFKRYDRDSSGAVDFGELEHVLRKEVGIRKTEIGDDELRMLWATLDQDGSGTVTIKEFAGFMRRYRNFGKMAFHGKVPITPIANVKELGRAILDAARVMQEQKGGINIQQIKAAFDGTEYEQFGGWLQGNAERYDEDGSGSIEPRELDAAVLEFQVEMERDRERLKCGSNNSNKQLPLDSMGGSEMMMKSRSPASLLDPRDPPGYKTVAGYSSIKREGAIMGNVPLRASDWSSVAEKLRLDFESKREARNRYEDTTFTGAPATALTATPLEGYKAGAHLNNSVKTRWGGERSRNSKLILIKGNIIPPEEKLFLLQLRESNKPNFWPVPMEGDLHWCQRLSAVPTMSSIMTTQTKYEELAGKIGRKKEK